MERRGHPRCSFCGKSRNQVKKLVAGPGVFICNECVQLCNEVINEAGPPDSGTGAARARFRARTSSGSRRTWASRWLRWLRIEAAQANLRFEPMVGRTYRNANHFPVIV